MPPRHRISAAQRTVCDAVLALAAACSARLQVIDAAVAAGASADESELEQASAAVVERMSELRERWDDAAIARPTSGLAVLGELLADDEELLLLALLAAPLMERSVAREYRRREQPYEYPPGVTDAGLLLDLAAPSVAERQHVASYLHPDQPLRRTRLVRASTREPLTAATTLTLAPCVLGALRGEPISPPPAVFESRPPVDPEFARQLLDSAELPVASIGEVAVLVGDQSRLVHLAQLMAGARGEGAWLLPGRMAPVDDRGWLDWLSDAMVAGAILVVTDGNRLAPTQLNALERAVHRCDRAALILTPATIESTDYAPHHRHEFLVSLPLPAERSSRVVAVLETLTQPAPALHRCLRAAGLTRDRRDQ